MSELTPTIKEEGPEDSSPPEVSEETSSERTLNAEPTEDKQPEEPQEPQEEAKEEAKEEPKQEPKEEPFHKHPRFQALINANRELREQSAALMAKLEEAKKPEPPPRKGVNDLLNLKDDELFEQLQENPRTFLQQFAEGIQGSTQRQMMEQFERFQNDQQSKSLEQVAEQNYQSFGEKNEGFWEMWDSGEIKAFMDKNPAHNAMSAFYELTLENQLQAKIDAEVAAAVEKTKKEMEKNLKAKKSVTYVPATGRTSTPQPTDPGLQNAKQRGGVVKVLAERLAARRAQGG